MLIMKYLKNIMALVLVVCLLPMPYEYYMILRLIAMLLFAIFAFEYYAKRAMPIVIIFCSLILIFQPFVKLFLGRGLWNLIDVIVAMFLAYLFYKENIQNN